MSDGFEGLPDQPQNGDWARYSFYVLNQLKTTNLRLKIMEDTIVELKTEQAVFKNNWKTLNLIWGFGVTFFATVLSIAATLIFKK